MRVAADPATVRLLLDGDLGLGAEEVGVADPDVEGSGIRLDRDVAIHPAGVGVLQEHPGHRLTPLR